MKLPTWIERTAKTLDLGIVLAACVQAAHHYFWLVQPTDAIFWVLVAIFFGRGQSARYLASVIREEMEKE